MNIESWCQVEGNSNQQWTRATRRHNPEAFTSTAFEQEQASKGRVVWAMANKPAQQSLARKKSFPQKCECISGLKRIPSFTTFVIINGLYTWEVLHMRDLVKGKCCVQFQLTACVHYLY